MQDLAVFVFPDFEDDRVQPVTHPTDCRKLLRNVRSPIEPIGLGEQLLRLLKTDTATRIDLPLAGCFFAHQSQSASRYDCYTTLSERHSEGRPDT